MEVVKKRILIGTPTPSYKECEMDDCLLQIMMGSRHHVERMTTEGVYVYAQQNILASYAVDNGYDYLFLLENDMVVPAEILDIFVSHLEGMEGLACVSTNYVQKAKRGLCRFTAKDEGWNEIRLEEESVGLQRVYAAPTGTMLIPVKMLREMREKLEGKREKWFGHMWADDAGGYMGNDPHFCRLVAENGYGMWIDNDMSKRVEHIGKRAFNWRDCYE